jgi:hypothetical protein
MALVLGVSKLLATVMDIGGLHLIIVGKVFLQLINRSIVLQLGGSLQEHLSPHQFRILTLGGYETIPFDIRTLLQPTSWLGYDVNPTLKMFLIEFLKLLFLKSGKMLGVLWQALSFLPSRFMVFIFLFTTNMVFPSCIIYQVPIKNIEIKS